MSSPKLSIYIWVVLFVVWQKPNSAQQLPYGDDVIFNPKTSLIARASFANLSRQAQLVAKKTYELNKLAEMQVRDTSLVELRVCAHQVLEHVLDDAHLLDFVLDQMHVYLTRHKIECGEQLASLLAGITLVRIHFDHDNFVDRKLYNGYLSCIQSLHQDSLPCIPASQSKLPQKKLSPK
jgi:hypothetical protein